MCKQTNGCSVINRKNGKQKKTVGHKTTFINYHYDIPSGQEVVRFFSILQLRAAAVSKSLSIILFYCNNSVPRRDLIRGNNSINARAVCGLSVNGSFVYPVCRAYIYRGSYIICTPLTWCRRHRRIIITMIVFMSIAVYLQRFFCCVIYFR